MLLYDTSSVHRSPDGERDPNSDLARDRPRDLGRRPGLCLRPSHASQGGGPHPSHHTPGGLSCFSKAFTTARIRMPRRSTLRWGATQGAMSRLTAIGPWPEAVEEILRTDQ